MCGIYISSRLPIIFTTSDYLDAYIPQKTDTYTTATAHKKYTGKAYYLYNPLHVS